MDFVQSTTETAFVKRNKSTSPYFGTSWRPNCLRQVTFWGIPEIVWVSRGKWAMSKACCNEWDCSRPTIFIADGIRISLIFLFAGVGGAQVKSTVHYYAESKTKEKTVARTKSPGGFRNLSAAQKKFGKVGRKNSCYFIHPKFARSQTTSYTTSITLGRTILVWWNSVKPP